MFSFRRERDDTEIGWIETGRGTKPESRVRSLLEAMKKPLNKGPVVWVGQMVSDVVDFRLILVASILVDLNRT
jgi:hypothetical protein